MTAREARVRHPSEAYRLAEQHGLHLEGLGGTSDGVIGALSAVGLTVTGDDGRIVSLGEWPDDLSGLASVATLSERGVTVRLLDTGETLSSGEVDVGKRLRPNLRQGRYVLFVERVESGWRGVKLV